MSDKLPSREQAIELLRQNHCSHTVIRHSEAVAEVALEIAKKLRKEDLKVDLDLIEIGALLHDFGRSKTHGVDHGVVGATLAESAGLPESVVRIIKRHVGGGITAQEAEAFGWPKDVYVPITLEEKIVSYADKLVDQSQRVPIDLEIKRLQLNNKAEAAERVRKIHDEILSLMDKPK